MLVKEELFMKRFGYFLFLVMLTTAMLTASVLNTQAAPTVEQTVQDTPDYRELDAKIKAEGSLMLIVGVKLPQVFTPEGYLDSSAAEQQRRAIRQAQETLMTSLGSGAEAYTLYDIIPFLAVRVDPQAWELLKQSHIVTHIEEDKPIPYTLESSVPVSGAPNVWAAGIEGSGWAVAVLDTGVQWDHEFFGGSASSRVVSEACYSNAGGTGSGVTLCPDDSNAQITGHAADPDVPGCSNTGSALDGGTRCTHGTHVAGISAGNHTGTSVTYDGTARGANIIAIQVFTRFNDAGSCGGSPPCVLSYTSDQILALQRVHTLSSTYNIAAVNMSLGGGKYTDSQQAQCDTDKASTKTVIDTLRSAGIATLIASGNNGYVDGISAPGCISTAIAVGASTDSDGIASFSNMSNMVELMAPGVAIDSSINSTGTSSYGSKQGTSMATPYAAGIWTLMRSYDTTATIDEILTALQTTGIPIADTRTGGTVTKPRVQVDAAMGLLKTNTWVGTSADWNTPGNWSTGQIPSRFESVTIPTTPSGGNFPTLNTNASVSNFTLESGAQFNVTGDHTLTIYNDFVGNSGSAFNATNGTVVFAGDWAQSVSTSGAANDHFYNLTIGNGSSNTALTPASNLNIDGNLTIGNGATLYGSTHTLNVGGNWTDSGTTFVPQNSTVIFDGTAQTIDRTTNTRTVMMQNFADYDGYASGSFSNAPPAGWSRSPATTSGWYFGRYTPVENGSDKAFAMRWYSGTPSAIDAWLFSNALTLEANKTYQLSFTYRVWSSADPQNFAVWLGNAASSDSMTQSVWSVTDTSSTTWATVNQTFQVAADGTYYLGFRNQDDSSSTYGVLLDNVNLTVTEGLEFYNLTVSSSTAADFNDEIWVKNNLTVSPNSVMDLNSNTLYVDTSLTNNGTLRQTLPVNSASVEFLHIQNKATSVTQYRGVVVDSTTNSQNLGNTTVDVRELNTGEYCTTAGAGSNAYARRCYQITPSTQPTAGQNVLVRLYARTADELNSIPEADLALYRFLGTGLGWTELGSRTTGSNGAYSYAEGVTDHFSAFLLGQTTSTPTAVELNRFSGSSAQSIALSGVLLLATMFILGAALHLRRRMRA